LHYYDLRTYLDLGSLELDRLKIVGVPVSYRAFLPVSWDAKVLQGQEVDTPAQLLNVSALSADKLEVTQGDLVAAGEDSGLAAYEAVSSKLSSAIRNLSYSEPQIPHAESHYQAPSIKLFLSLLYYQTNSAVDAENRDRIGLLLDKLALIAVMGFLMDRDVLKRCIAGAGDGAEVTLATFDDRMREELSNVSLITINRRGLLEPHDRCQLQISLDRWGPLFALGRGWHGEEQFLLPIDALEEISRENLERQFNWFLEDDESAAAWKTLSGLVDAVNAGNGASSQRRSDYGFFYPLIDKFLDQQLQEGFPGSPGSQSLNIYKLRFRPRLPQTPVVEEIDTRATVWAAEANALSTEFYLAEHRVKLAKAQLGAASEPGATITPTKLEAIAEELREANRALFAVRSNLEVLKDELGHSGFTLDRSQPGEAADGDFGIHQTHRTRTLVVPRERSWYSWQTTVYLRIGPFRIRRAVTRGRFEWYEHQRFVDRIEKRPISIEWRPIEDYLAQKIPEAAYDSADGSGSVKERLKIALRFKDGEDEAQLINGRKDVRILELTDSGYRDQNGVSLERILEGAEDELQRARLLLLLPIEERRSNGTNARVGYRALHNPVATRRSYQRPSVFLVETYRHELRQLPGNWLGPLSHVVSLFPGERRTLTLEAQSRYASELIQEQSASQSVAVERKLNVSSQVRRDLEKTEENGKKKQWNAKASGGVNLGFAKFGGGAGGGGESYKSQKTFSKIINDRVSESLQRTSSSNEVQFATSSSTSVTSSSSSQQVIEVENVNKGRVVNHKYFQVQARYQSSIALAKIKVVVEYGEEILPGLGVAHTNVYELDELDQLFPEMFEKERQAAISAVRQAVDKRAQEAEYQLQDGGLNAPVELEKREWYVNSGFYFVDSQVSPSPSTEPYVENAREAEVQERKARADKLAAEAEAIRQGKLVLPDQVGRLSLDVDSAAGKE
jgi:hypothetical protein